MHKTWGCCHFPIAMMVADAIRVTILTAHGIAVHDDQRLMTVVNRLRIYKGTSLHYNVR
jgi:hypothetical protein